MRRPWPKVNMDNYPDLKEQILSQIREDRRQIIEGLTQKLGAEAAKEYDRDASGWRIKIVRKTPHGYLEIAYYHEGDKIVADIARRLGGGGRVVLHHTNFPRYHSRTPEMSGLIASIEIEGTR